MTPAQHAAIDAKVAELMGLKDVRRSGQMVAHCTNSGLVPVPRYSTDTAAALTVVDVANRKPRNISIAFSPVSDKWLVQFLSYRNSDGTFNVSESGSAEHPDRNIAICFAFLRAHGIDPDTLTETPK